VNTEARVVWSTKKRICREIHPKEKQVTDFLCTNLENPITLEDLSHQLGLSPSHTSRWVSQHFNKTFLQILLQLRLRQAALWLSRTELSVTKISFKLPFCDQAHFSKMFKREFKCFPLKHRQQQKELRDGSLS
jgi:AraC-like DNA-binding protein